MKVVCTTLLIETSPQALPLGAACIASAIKHHKATKDIAESTLVAISREDKGYQLAKEKNQHIQYIVDQICKDGVPHFACFSVYVWNRKELEEAAKLIKEKYPTIITIGGGPEVTANPQSFSAFDYTVAGEGELAMPELIRLAYDGKTAEIPGVYAKILKEHNVDCSNPQLSVCRSTPPNLAEISSPYLDGTLDVSQYGGALWELARGCPFKCSYCYESKGEKKIQYFPIERIQKEIELFNQKKISQVFVLDPTYNANKKRAIELLNLIAKKAPGMFFYFEARAEFIDRELAKAFTKIPCALQFGLQSSDPEVLSYVHRTLDKKLFTKNIGYLNETGAIFGFDLIYGLPKDTLEGFKKSIDFALNLYPNNLETFCLSVLPGTDLADNAKELGLEYEDTAPYHVIKTDRFSVKDMEAAATLSHACNVFYNQGRAVPWFNSVCRLLKARPAILLERFADYIKANNKDEYNNSIEKLDFACFKHEKIESIQLEFLKGEFFRCGKQKEWKAAESIIRFNGALSRVEANKSMKESIRLAYHPDDLATPYATDIKFFAQNCQSYNCTTQIFYGKNGVQWKCQKS